MKYYNTFIITKFKSKLTIKNILKLFIHTDIIAFITHHLSHLLPIVLIITTKIQWYSIGVIDLLKQTGSNFREENKKWLNGINVGSTLKSTTNLKALIPLAFLHGPGAKAIMVMVIPRINSFVTHEAILSMYTTQSSSLLSVKVV